jgi:hypothetical protein
MVTVPAGDRPAHRCLRAHPPAGGPGFSSSGPRTSYLPDTDTPAQRAARWAMAGGSSSSAAPGTSSGASGDPPRMFLLRLRRRPGGALRHRPGGCAG